MLKVKEEIYEISYNNEVIDLTPKEYELLKTLIYQSHKVLSKSEITEQIWPNKTPKSRVVDSYVSRIRKKLNKLGHPGIKVITKKDIGLSKMSIIQPKCWAKFKKINKAKYQSKIQIF